jgi:hypothetical protein
MITSSSTESLKGAAFLSKMLGILHGKRVPSPHAELVAVVNSVSKSLRRLFAPSAILNGDFECNRDLSTVTACSRELCQLFLRSSLS